MISQRLGLVFLLLVGSGLTPAQASPVQRACMIPNSQLLETPAISAEKLSLGLWWAKKQFDPFDGKLINDWKVNVNERRIDIVVDRQLWSKLDYMQRYRLVNSLGSVARRSHYGFRIFTPQRQCLANYACNYLAIPPRCEVSFASEQDGMPLGQTSAEPGREHQPVGNIYFP